MPDPTRSNVSVPGLDLILVTAGGVLAVNGLAALGVPLLLVGLLLPLLQWRVRRSGDITHLLRLVPREVADAHGAVVSAAGRPGIVDPGEVVTTADELVLEVAAVLGGRPARRASQRRFVTVRLAALSSLAADLTERHEAWLAAMDELDALVPLDAGEVSVEDATASAWLSTIVLVLLAPVFLVVDAVRGAGRLSVALVDGVALRLRTVVDLAMAALRAVGRAIAGALTRWRALIATMRLAVRTARGRFVAARTLALRRLRGRPRGLRGRSL